MKYDISISPLHSAALLRTLSLINFDVPKDVNAINRNLINAYLNKIFVDSARVLIQEFSEDPNNRLFVDEDNKYEFVVNDELHDTMTVLFAASKNKKTAASLEKFFATADILPFDYALFCLHVLMMDGFQNLSFALSLRDHLFSMQDIQALRFLSRIVTVLRLNSFVSISNSEVDPSIYKAFNLGVAT